MRNKLKNKIGFTLAELLVTVMIIIILLAVGAPKILEIQKNLRQTELDAQAETIYVAVQNKLTKMKASGNTAVLKKGTQLATKPGDCTDEDIEDGDIWYFTSADYNNSDTSAPAYKIAHAVMEGDTVPSLVGNHWVVEYNPSNCTVYAVFYSEKRANCADGYANSYGKYDTALRYKDQRLADGANVGYYCGGAAGSSENLKEVYPSIQIINDEKLTAIITCTLPTGVTATPVFKVEIEDTENNVNTATYDLGANNFDTMYPYAAKSVSGNTYTLTLTLDDLTSDTSRFVSLYGKQTEADSTNTTKLLCGTDITIKVTVSCTDKTVTSNRSVKATTNSLFDYDPLVTTTDSSTGKITALIRYGRHLQNLDSSSSVSENVTSAIQVDNIFFTDQEGKTATKDWYETYHTSYFNGTNASGALFRPISNSNLSLYDGESSVTDEETTTIYQHMIANLNVDSSSDNASATSNIDAGLFCILGTESGQTVQNVTLTGAKVSSGTNSDAAAGALAGKIRGSATLKNCVVYLTDSDRTGKTNQDVWISGYTAGGLVGMVSSNDEITITKCSASTVVGDYDLNSEGKVATYHSNCVGGLIGSSSGTVSITGSYADNYLVGYTSGGLVGIGSDALTINTCYAAGFMTFYDMTTSAGLVNTAAQIQNSYDVMLGLNLDAGTSLQIQTSSCSNMSDVYYMPDSAKITTLKTNTSLQEVKFENISPNPSTYQLMADVPATYDDYPVLSALTHYGDYNESTGFELTLIVGSNSTFAYWGPSSIPSEGIHNIDDSYDVPEIEGWTLDGWYNSAAIDSTTGKAAGIKVLNADGTVVNPDADISDPDGKFTITHNATGTTGTLTLSDNLTLYACWTKGEKGEMYVLVNSFTAGKEYILASGNTEGDFYTVYLDSIPVEGATATLTTGKKLHVTKDEATGKTYILTSGQSEFTDWTSADWAKLEWKAEYFAYKVTDINTMYGIYPTDKTDETYVGFYLENVWVSNQTSAYDTPITAYLNNDVTYQYVSPVNNVTTYTYLGKTKESNEYAFEFRMWRYDATNGLVPCYGHDCGCWNMKAYFLDSDSKIYTTGYKGKTASTFPSGSTHIYIYEKQTIDTEETTFDFYPVTYINDTTSPVEKAILYYAVENGKASVVLPSADDLNLTIPEGKSFKDWKDSKGTPHAAGVTLTIDGSTEYTAEWADPCSVTLVGANGGSESTTISVPLYTTDDFSEISGYPTPSRSESKWTFTGWYTSQDGGTLIVDKNGKVQPNTDYSDSNGKWTYNEKPVTLYARWSDGCQLRLVGTSTNTYTVQLGTTSMAGLKDSEGTTYRTPTRDGWTFDGWCAAKDDTTTKGGSLIIKADEDGSFQTTTAYTSEGKWTATGNVTLYARWKRSAYIQSSSVDTGNTYLIGGTPSSSSTIQLVYGTGTNSNASAKNVAINGTGSYATDPTDPSVVSSVILIDSTLGDNYKWIITESNGGDFDGGGFDGGGFDGGGFGTRYTIQNVGLTQYLRNNSGTAQLNRTATRWSISSTTITSQSGGDHPKTYYLKPDASLTTSSSSANCYIYKEVTVYDWSEDTDSDELVSASLFAAPMMLSMYFEESVDDAYILTLQDGSSAQEIAVENGDKQLPAEDYIQPTAADSTLTLDGWYTADDETGVKLLNADGTIAAIVEGYTADASADEETDPADEEVTGETVQESATETDTSATETVVEETAANSSSDNTVTETNDAQDNSADTENDLTSDSESNSANLVFALSGDATLYARWSETVPAEAADTVEETQTTNDNSENTEELVADAKTVAEESINTLTLYNGTSVYMTGSPADGTSSFSDNFNEPTRTDWTLDGWYTTVDETGVKILNADGSIVVDGDGYTYEGYTSNGTFALTANAALYARWSRLTAVYVLTEDKNEPVDDEFYLYTVEISEDGQTEQYAYGHELDKTDIYTEPVDVVSLADVAYSLYDEEMNLLTGIEFIKIDSDSNENLEWACMNGKLTAEDGTILTIPETNSKQSDATYHLYKRTAVYQITFADEVSADNSEEAESNATLAENVTQTEPDVSKAETNVEAEQKAEMEQEVEQVFTVTDP